jgi:hypothetical protein
LLSSEQLSGDYLLFHEANDYQLHQHPDNGDLYLAYPSKKQGLPLELDTSYVVEKIL